MTNDVKKLKADFTTTEKKLGQRRRINTLSKDFRSFEQETELVEEIAKLKNAMEMRMKLKSSEQKLKSLGKNLLQKLRTTII